MLLSKEELAPESPATVMIEVPKQPLPAAPMPEPPQPSYVSASAATQMISMEDFSPSELKMAADSAENMKETPFQQQDDSAMATMMVERPEPPKPPAPQPPPPPPKAPQATMRPAQPPLVTMRPAPPPEPAVTMRPEPAAPVPAPKPAPPPPEPPRKKETAKQKTPAPFAAPQVTPPPAPAPQQPAPTTASIPKPAAAGAKPGGGSLKLLGIIAVGLAVLIGIAGAAFFIIPKFIKPAPEEPKPIAKPIQVAPKPVEQPKPVEAPPQLPTVGKLTISSEPPGAAVFLDSEQKGVTPLEVPDITFGKHIVKLTLKGYSDNQQEIEFSADNSQIDVPVVLEKAVPQSGTLVVQSNPEGAFIIVNNRALGTTPKTLGNQKPGKVAVTLKKDGYRDYSETIRISAGKSVNINANLEEIPKVVVKPPEPVKPVEPEVRRGELVTLGPDVTPPKSIKKAFAKYPDAARRQRLEGVVGLSILVSETGQVIDVKVTRSANPILDEAAVSAVKEWQYQPATKKGVQVRVWLPVSMSFQAGR
jgi:TonB family protein